MWDNSDVLDGLKDGFCLRMMFVITMSVFLKTKSQLKERKRKTIIFSETAENELFLEKSQFAY